MKNRRRTLASTLTVLSLFAGTQLSAQKGGSTPPPNWPCVITFHQSVADAGGALVSAVIQGDGAGAYVDGQSGVSCYIDQNSSSSHYGYLFVNAARTSPRYFLFPGQLASLTYTRQGYDTFENRQPGYFEITQIRTVSFNAADATQQTARRRVRIGVGYHLDFDGGEFWGNSDATDTLTKNTESAWVTPLNACSWDVSWHPAPGAVLALREGSSKSRVRTADFSMPFAATVTVTGVKPGC